ncbi:hypothetical protein EDC94DRAFT_559778 [Helicostylum pulchrum]|nr:hypothetical protein EDC94DRAFT_559778 [Helicostylum pulchrum]
MQAPGVFLMNKKQRVEVPVNFKEKDVLIVPFIEFYLTLVVCNAGCEESSKVLKQLEEEHKVVVNAKAIKS